MASRQMLRRLAPLFVNSIQCRLCIHPPQTLLSKHNQLHRVSHVTAVRSLATKAKFECINIQDEEDFQKRVMENKTPVIVDFHATWCGPCTLLGPRLESIIAGKQGQVVLAKVDIDDNADLAVRFGVESVPTVVSIKEGKQMDKFIGLREDDYIDSFIEKVIN